MITFSRNKNFVIDLGIFLKLTGVIILTKIIHLSFWEVLGITLLFFINLPITRSED